MSSYPELVAQIRVLEQTARETRARELPTVIADIQEKMALFGIAPSDVMPELGGRMEKAPAKKRAIRFRDDEGNTWTGGGSHPRWLTAKLAAGAKLDDFRVA